MSFDPELADRVRALLALDADVVEKPMFGGLSFLIGGHIAVAVSSAGGLLMRAEADEREQLLAMAHVRPAVMGKRTMNGWVHVDAAGVAADGDLREWVGLGVNLARSLPAR
ncbi:MAG: TfoX/Sxy family protein [Solirubrobacteraceae bacterium]